MVRATAPPAQAPSCSAVGATRASIEQPAAGTGRPVTRAPAAYDRARLRIRRSRRPRRQEGIRLPVAAVQPHLGNTGAHAGMDVAPGPGGGAGPTEASMGGRISGWSLLGAAIGVPGRARRGALPGARPRSRALAVARPAGRARALVGALVPRRRPSRRRRRRSSSRRACCCPGDGGHSPLEGLSMAPDFGRQRARGRSRCARHAPVRRRARAGGARHRARLRHRRRRGAVLPAGERATKVLASAGGFAAISALFGGPLVAGMLLVEGGIGMGAMLLPVLLPGLRRGRRRLPRLRRLRELGRPRGAWPRRVGPAALRRCAPARPARRRRRRRARRAHRARGPARRGEGGQARRPPRAACVCCSAAGSPSGFSPNSEAGSAPTRWTSSSPGRPR